MVEIRNDVQTIFKTHLITPPYHTIVFYITRVKAVKNIFEIEVLKN